MTTRHHVAKDTHAYLGRVVDNGHCMRHVQVVAGVPHSSTLRRGAHVKTADIPRGAIIATFNKEGRYANATNGSSHIAIFLEKLPEGIRVVDQWRGQPVHERTIRYKGGGDQPVNDADAYYVAESEIA